MNKMTKLNQLQLISQLYSDDSNSTMDELNDKIDNKTDEKSNLNFKEFLNQEINESQNLKVEELDSLSKKPKISEIDKCSVCVSNIFKYKCPSCLLKTCSLDCFKQHKIKFDCTGLRNSLKFKRLANFDDGQLKSDLKFLEDYDRELSGIKRQKRNIVQSMDDLPNWLKKLKYEAFRRMIKLKILPAGFNRRLQNKTTFMYSTKEIHWDIEFIFPDLNLKRVNLIDKNYELSFPKKITIHVNRVPENRVLKDLLKTYIRPTNLIENQKFNSFLKFYQIAEEDEILVLIKLPFNYYVQLDQNKTISECLKFKTVIEYPTILVILKQNLKNYQIISENELKDKMQEWADKNYGLLLKKGVVKKSLNFNSNGNRKDKNDKESNDQIDIDQDIEDVDKDKEKTELKDNELKDDSVNQNDYYEESEDDDSPLEIQTRFVFDNSYNFKF